MSDLLAQTTCRIHFERPASARCPSCRQFYCVECITEHDGKLTCASCLTETHEENVEVKKGRGNWFQPMPIIHALMGLVFVWVVFYVVAQLLTAIPDSFHDGTIWGKEEGGSTE